MPPRRVFPDACTIKTLPDSLQLAAARTAIAVNPVNAPPLAAALAYTALAIQPVGLPGTPPPVKPLSLVGLVSRYWGPEGVKLGVTFLDNPSPTLRRKILEHMNAWSAYANVTFREAKQAGEVRIARTPGHGYWSYLGTDIQHVPAGEPTMNLDSFAANTPLAEFRRVVRHETGHTLGFPHEHMRKDLIDRLDERKTFDYFAAHYFWNEAMTRAQVLTPLDPPDLIGSPTADELSVMCYMLPASITRDGLPIRGGPDLSALDRATVARIYPKPRKSSRKTSSSLARFHSCP